MKLPNTILASLVLLAAGCTFVPSGYEEPNEFPPMSDAYITSGTTATIQSLITTCSPAVVQIRTTAPVFRLKSASYYFGGLLGNSLGIALLEDNLVLRAVNWPFHLLFGWFEFNNPYKWHASGSAFFMTPEIMVTAAHVVDDAEDIYVIGNGVRFKAEILTYRGKNGETLRCLSEEDDIALLHVPGQRFDHTLQLRFQQTRVGEPVYALGYPSWPGDPNLSATVHYEGLRRGNITVTAGRIARSHVERVNADISIFGGHSGGPLVDEAGHVVGVNISHGIPNRRMAFATPTYKILVRFAEAIRQLAERRDHAYRR